MAINKKDMKIFNMRLTKEMWLFLRVEAAKAGGTMTDIVTECLDKYKMRIDNKMEKKLTKIDTNV